MMDGFEVLSQTEMWKQIKRAEDALFDAQQACEKNGFGASAGFVYRSRLELGTAENCLREHFKRMSRKASDLAKGEVRP